jgi:hypothetical protein
MLIVGSIAYFAGYEHPRELLFAQVMFVVTALCLDCGTKWLSKRRLAMRERAQERGDWLRSSYATLVDGCDVHEHPPEHRDPPEATLLAFRKRSEG